MWNAGDVMCRFEYEQNKRRPYVEKVHSYNLDMDVSQGTLEYTGYYYVEDSAFPQQLTMNLYKTEAEPAWVNMSGDTIRTKYNFLFDYVIDIEIYRREQYEDTSQPFDDDEDGGQICLFPTHREQIWFRILDKKECSGRNITQVV